MMPAIEKHGVRTQPRRRAQRHGRLNAVFSRLVARRGNHAALIRLPSDNHGLAAQFRPIEQFDRNEKGVHIDVKNGGAER